MRSIIILTISMFLSSGLYAENVSLTADGKVPGKPFEVMQAQIDALNSRLATVEAKSSTNTGDITQVVANVNQQASGILGNQLAVVETKEDLDAIANFSRYLSKCVDLKLLVLGTFEQLLDEQDDLQDGSFKQITWLYYSLDANDEITATEQTQTLDADALNEVIKELENLAECIRNEEQLMSIPFASWTEKQDQQAQQLSSVLRVMRDILRIGVGGVDLGSG